MERALRRGTAYGRADTRCRPGRQEPRHSRQGADDEGGPRTRNSGRVRNRVRRPVHIGPHDLRHGQQRQDDHDDADLRDSAPRGRERRSGGQHRPEFRAVGRHGAARLVRNRAEQLSARWVLRFPGRHRGADEHYARSFGPVRVPAAELCRQQIPHPAQPASAGLLYLLRRRSADARESAEASALHADAPVQRPARRLRRRVARRDDTGRGCRPPAGNSGFRTSDQRDA